MTIEPLIWLKGLILATSNLQGVTAKFLFIYLFFCILHKSVGDC